MIFAVSKLTHVQALSAVLKFRLYDKMLRQMLIGTHGGVDFPTKLSQYAHCKLHIGHICEEHNKTFNKMSSREKITDDNILT